MPTGFAVTYFAYGGTFPLTSQPFRNATSSSAQVQVGACRDSTGHFSSPRIECPAGKTHFSELVTRCVALGARCDAVDIDSEPVAPGHDPVVSWCVCVCVCVCARARVSKSLPLLSLTPPPPSLPFSQGGGVGAEHHGSGCDGRVDVLLRRRLQRNGCNEGERVQGG